MNERSRLVKKFLAVFLFPFLICACNSNKEANYPSNTSSELPVASKYVAELTQEQESAFDALNAIQINTDEQNRLYSTFPDIHQPCYPPDTNIVITQAQFLSAMEQFAYKHCKRMDKDQRVQLTTVAVLAQSEYKVLYCPNHSGKTNYDNGLPMTGTWVMPSVLGHRDIILEW